jgi:farnesyl-diphosphate farnesyltransferase
MTLLSQLSQSDREAVRNIVTTLTKGMEFDLHPFPDESSGRVAPSAHNTNSGEP